jgi:SpoVK/Ycf46/Vps4 family AAA+-type ATPase
MPLAYERLIRLWSLRLLVKVGGHRNMVKPNYLEDDRTLGVLGVKINDKNYNQKEVLASLFAHHERIELRLPAVPERAALTRNLRWLADQVGLNGTEEDILRFAVLMEQHPSLHNCSNSLGHLNLFAVVDSLAVVLGRPRTEVREALLETAPLARSGLLTCRNQGTELLPQKLALVGGLGDELMVSQKDPLGIFSPLFRRAPNSSLGQEDLPHLLEPLRTMEAYLRSCLGKARKGVNVLLHGAPGTGKTEFVRMLAPRLGCGLYEIASDHGTGLPIRGQDRLRAFHLSQAFLERKRDMLVLFDEVEDVFSFREEHGPARGNGNGSGIKAWIHRTLEENPVPSFWVTNDLSCIDPAHLRRFDLIQEFKVPPRNVRARIFDRYCGSLPMTAPVRTAILDHPGIPPAWLERAAKVVRDARMGDPGIDAGDNLLRVLSENLIACDQAPLQVTAEAPLLPYRLDCLQADCDLAGLKAGLEREGRGRFCLFGPPGTGKTAFGHHLAEALERPLQVKRASDLISMWVGETEKKVARMFEAAKDAGAILLLDEADGFLRERAGAIQSWQVTQVNEMLTRMESFSGIFIASTNLMDDLDQAALRRFDVKIRFDYLKADQAWALFQDAAAGLNFEADTALRPDLDRLRILTPGDFATVIRKARLTSITDAIGLLKALEEECRLKPEGKKRMVGF